MAQRDLLDELTVGELDYAGRALGISVMAVVIEGEQHPRYPTALAAVLWLHARRTNTKTELSEFTGLRFAELATRIAELAGGDDVDQADELTDEQLVEADPTDPAPASS